MESLSEYDAFAPYYDAFTAGSDYEAGTVRILELLRAHGLRGQSLLDLACGTGKSFLPFLARGFEVTGCDRSSGMLERAARAAPRVTLVQADLRDLPVLGSFDLVTCLDDSLNYLLDERALGAAFTGMARNLRRGGLAAFDLNSLQAYRTTFASDCVSEHEDGVVFAWRGRTAPDAPPGCAAEARIDVFAPTGGGSYERVVSRHRQRHFGRETVVRLLEEAGLESLAVRGMRADASLAEPADEGTHLKLLYIARRAEGGEPT